MSILVAGVNGFVGHHVAQQLHEQNYEIVGVNLEPNLAPDLEGIVDTYVSCDLTDEKAVSDLDLHDVTAIINLAGFAAVGASKGKGELYNRVNVGVHTTLYSECLRQKVSPRIIAVSSGAVYDTQQAMPLTEESRLVDDAQTNEYVISKKLMEEAVGKFSADGLRCIIARPFNHTGPGQLPGFLLPDLTEQVIHAQQTHQAMKVGNLEPRRDFTDVRDVAGAYVLLATCDASNLKHSVYNICSGRSISAKQVLAILLDASGASDVTVEVDPSKLRDNDVMDIFGASTRLQEDTGWKPEIPIEQTVADFVAWKQRA